MPLSISTEGMPKCAPPKKECPFLLESGPPANIQGSLQAIKKISKMRRKLFENFME